MPSSQGDRRSYARRRQYGVFTAYLIAISAVLFGLLAAIAWKLDPVGFSNVRLFVAEVTAPAARVVRSGTSAGSGVDDSLSAWWRAGSQNASLKAQLTEARREIIRARGLEAENAQLRALLALTRGDVRPVAVAQLLSTSASSTRRFGLLDAGHSDGVRPGQPVRSSDGLIGRTLEVGPTVSRILLITDRQSVVPVRRARDGLAAIVAGRGDELLEVRPLNAASNPLKVGD
ncbi:MAG: rod shape-determining protein MreC, partial [Sphingopyxis sp.]|nr:rod shape-determining protein MreC [Sphingopyxis sp.]